MKIPVLIMAGGKATRFDFSKTGSPFHEKALLKVENKFFIEKILAAVTLTRQIGRIIVAVSPHTPETKDFLVNATMDIEIIDTPGLGYHEDLVDIVKYLELGATLTIGADIPLIQATYLDQIIKFYFHSKKPALTVMCPLRRFEDIGLTPTTISRSPEYTCPLVPLGINIIDGTLIEQPSMEEAVYLLEEEALVFNINTVEDYNMLLLNYQV